MNTEANPIALTMTDAEARAVQAVLRDYAAKRWDRDGENIGLCLQVQCRIRQQFIDQYQAQSNKPCNDQTEYTGIASSPMPADVQFEIEKTMREHGLIERCPCRLCVVERNDPNECNEFGGPRFMIFCHCCGNKRCPHADNHEFRCTDSNETGQIGVRYATPESDGYPHKFADQVARITEMGYELGISREPTPDDIQEQVSAMMRERESQYPWWIRKQRAFFHWQADHFWLTVGGVFAFAVTVGIVAYLVALATSR